MFSFASRAFGWSRLAALRRLYRNFLRENSPEGRGRRLLREWLSREQLAQFDKHSYFDVIGCDSGRRYRIHYGTAGNVHELDDTGIPRLGWCFVPAARLVPGDVMLAQKVALETNERLALEVANKFLVRVSALRFR